MDSKALSGAEKAQLRGVGQRLPASFKIGKEGLTPVGLTELRRQLTGRGLVKVRHLGADRDARAELNLRIASETGTVLVGSVGQTALFFLPEAAARIGGGS